MKDLFFNSIEELCCCVSDKYNSLSDKNEDISIIAKYSKAKKIIKSLIYIGYDIASIDIHQEDFELYYGEYIISINEDGIWVEKFKRENGYFTDSSSIAYVSNDCNSACIKHIDSKLLYSFEIVDEDDYEEDCSDDYACCEKCDDDYCNSLDTNTTESTHISRDKDGKPVGFTKSWSDSIGNVSIYSSYSHYSTDRNTLDKIADVLNIKLY